MVRINLLPWREELKRQRQKEFLSYIGFAVLFVGALLMASHSYVNGLKDYQVFRNNLLQTEITELDKKISEVNEIEAKKNKLLVKIQLIQGLQESRPQIVHIFEELAKRTPEGVFLTLVKLESEGVTIDGKAQSNARVSTFMREVESSNWLRDPKLSIIKGQEPEPNQAEKQSSSSNSQASDFTLFAKQSKPEDKAAPPGKAK